MFTEMVHIWSTPNLSVPPQLNKALCNKKTSKRNPTTGAKLAYWTPVTSVSDHLMNPGTNKNLCNGCPKNIFLMHKNFVSDSYFQTEVQEKGVPPHSYEATGGKTKKAAVNRTYQDSMSTKKSRETRPKR